MQILKIFMYNNPNILQSGLMINWFDSLEKFLEMDQIHGGKYNLTVAYEELGLLDVIEQL